MKKFQHFFALFKNARRFDVVKTTHEIKIFERGKLFVKIGAVRYIAEQCLGLVWLSIRSEGADKNLAGRRR